VFKSAPPMVQDLLAGAIQCAKQGGDAARSCPAAPGLSAASREELIAGKAATFQAINLVCRMHMLFTSPGFHRCLAMLAVAALLSFSAAAQNRACTPDRDGQMVCPPPNASCLQDREGQVVCSTPGGGIAIDRYGKAACGPGSCVADNTGELSCSNAPQGAASLDRYGKATCTGACAPASAALCVIPSAAK
jgi:hypothetical protein